MLAEWGMMIVEKIQYFLRTGLLMQQNVVHYRFTFILLPMHAGRGFVLRMDQKSTLLTLLSVSASSEGRRQLSSV